jgi:hypothetical protein
MQLHPGEWGPVERAAAVLVAGATIGLGVWLGTWLWPGQCGHDLREVGGECVGVTDESFDVEDPDVQNLLREVEKENAAVRAEYESTSHTPYVRIALTMPFTSDSTSSMTPGMIRRALAGALAGQKEVNEGPAPHLQLLPAPDGKNLDKWRPVHERLSELAEEKETPLVGVTGIPSSTSETREAIDDLSAREIPAIGPIITSADMNSEYFFKTSPSNEEFVKALEKYLEDDPVGAGKKRTERGFLVWDRGSNDVYSKNLRKVIRDRFGKTWGLPDSTAPYLGVTGEHKGIPQRFNDAVRKICRGSDYDTVFFAGRDQDLPAFVEKLADEPCGDDRELRILKVGIGLEPTLTTAESRQNLLDARATLVDASSVDTAWWRGGEAPGGVKRFLREFGELKKSHDLGGKPLDDGYAAMYYDAVQVFAEAVDSGFDDANEKSTGPVRIPDKDVVYDTLLDPTIDEDRCDDCIRGAGGTYGFGYEGEGQNEKWSVCKPVPVLEFGLSTGEKAAPRSVSPQYRTYRGTAADACPPD